MQLDATKFADLMSDLPVQGDHVCVAVSGGADSLALALLLRAWAPDLQITALSVDHGLRPEAAEECAWVKDVLTSYGLCHVTLKWEGEKPENGIQKAARDARYDLMGRWCRAHGVSDLFIAHHQDDQAETFLMRLSRGSGVDGLAAMQKVTPLHGFRLIRPLLDVPKSALEAYLKDKGQSWKEDPSNSDRQFDRVKIRDAREQFEAMGLTSDRLTKTARAMSRVRKLLEKLTEDWLRAHVSFSEAGFARFALKALFDEEEEIQLRVLSRIGQAVSGETYPPRLEKLERLCRDLLAQRYTTLMGCRWLGVDGDVVVCREIRHDILPENLYNIDLKGCSGPVQVRVLGEDGWRHVCKDEAASIESNWPKPVIYALVSIWDEEGVCLVPHLGYKRSNIDFEAELRINHAKALFRLAHTVK